MEYTVSPQATAGHIEVELLGEGRTWGHVQVLRTPVCLLLEDISPDHQHIDLIYFGRIVGGTLEVDPLEASQHRWYTHAELAEDEEIAADIRILGQQAIAAVAAHKEE